MMFGSKTIKTTISCAAVVLLLSNFSKAEPILLVEIHNVGSSSLTSGEPEMGFHFDIGIQGSDWGVLATQNDVGKTFFAPSDLLQIYNEHLTSPEFLFVSLTCCGATAHSFGAPPALNFGNVGRPFVTVTRVAPNLGPNLVGYVLTDLTQTIDDITITHVSDMRYNRSDAHTVRIYGEVVPEPATLLLVSTSLLFCRHSRRIRLTGRKLSPVAL
jgi:hypothetical protein